MLILWADDEIQLLRPQIMFLENKGCEVIQVSNGHDALEEIKEKGKVIEIVFLDESMPGITGLETLDKIKEINPQIPVVMVTRNEEDGIMEQAFGSKITDYLIKPVNAGQLWSCIRKITDSERLIREKTGIDYQQEFRNIFATINSQLDYKEWQDIYKRIVSWELKLDEAKITHLDQIIASQKDEANNEFSKFIQRNYIDWINEKQEAPVMSHDLMRSMIFPDLRDDKPTMFILLDNLRYDQWKMIEPIISEYYSIEEEDTFYATLPTTTQYSRNSIFAGMLPSEIQQNFPDWWYNDNEQGGKNLYEKDLLGEQIRRLVRKPIKWDYIKVVSNEDAKALTENINNYLNNNNFLAIVYNFIDMLSHARTEMEILKELASDEKAYRSLTKSWFLHSPIWEIMKTAAERDIQVFIATDHGSIRVSQASKVIGDRETTTNLRYKVGKNLQYDKRDVFDIRNPEDAGLPRPNVSSTFIFAKSDRFFLYPNNYNHFNNYYNNTFQHGGISLEEIIVPVVKLHSKK